MAFGHKPSASTQPMDGDRKPTVATPAAARSVRIADLGSTDHSAGGHRSGDHGLADLTFCCRVDVRAGTLTASIAEHGQRTPIIIRYHPTLPRQFQIIAGFRRVAALRALGELHVMAVVELNLSDEAALRLALLDNAQRNTLCALDLANTILKLEKQGLGSGEVARLMGCSRRQKNNLKSLLSLPVVARQALNDELAHFSATHALVLREAARRTGTVDYAQWLAVVRDERLSVRQLRRRLTAANVAQLRADPEPVSLFNANETDFDAGVVRLLPVKIATRTATAEAIVDFATDARQLLALLDAAGAASTTAEGTALPDAGSDGSAREVVADAHPGKSISRSNLQNQPDLSNRFQDPDRTA